MESDFVPVFSVQHDSYIKLFLLILCPAFAGFTLDNCGDFRINYHSVFTDIIQSVLYLLVCSCRDHFLDLVYGYAVFPYGLFQQQILCFCPEPYILFFKNFKQFRVLRLVLFLQAFPEGSKFVLNLLAASIWQEL